MALAPCSLLRTSRQSREKILRFRPIKRGLMGLGSRKRLPSWTKSWLILSSCTASMEAVSLKHHSRLRLLSNSSTRVKIWWEIEKVHLASWQMFLFPILLPLEAGALILRFTKCSSPNKKMGSWKSFKTKKSSWPRSFYNRNKKISFWQRTAETYLLGVYPMKTKTLHCSSPLCAWRTPIPSRRREGSP